MAQVSEITHSTEKTQWTNYRARRTDPNPRQLPPESEPPTKSDPRAGSGALRQAAFPGHPLAERGTPGPPQGPLPGSPREGGTSRSHISNNC